MFAFLFRMFDRSEHPAAESKLKHQITPNLEALEDRWMPSTSGVLSVQSLLGNDYNMLNSTAITSPAPVPNQQQATATFTPFTTGGSQTRSVAQFDPALGTLNSVQVILNGTLSSDVKVENLDNAPSTVNAQVNGNLSLQGPSGTSLSVSPTIVENGTALAPNDGTLDYSGPSGYDFGQQSASAQKSITLTNNLSAWEGTGNVNLTESAKSASTVSGSGNEQVQISSEGSGTATVIYNYTPAPPPALPPVSPASPPPPPPCMSPPPVSPASPPAGSCDAPTGPATIDGIVYLAPSQSASFAVGDQGVSNVKVTLTGVTLTQQQVSLTTTTDTHGYYSFTDLQPGLYELTDQPIPSNYTAGAATPGSYGGVVTNGEILLALPQGGDAMCYDFGLLAPSPSVVPFSPPPPPPSPPPSSLPPPPPPPAQTNYDPPPVLTKRSLLGDGWQSLG